MFADDTNLFYSNNNIFRKSSKKGDTPLRVPLLSLSKTLIKRKLAIKLPGVIIDENITWRAHIYTIEPKIAKNIGLLYKARQYLDKECLNQLYFLYRHSDLIFANSFWATTHTQN